jgi:pimeloyl-ACP methyl ester carboxylesterase
VLSTFQSLVGQPTRTIAWGHSLGGMVTAGLVQQYPTLFDGAQPMCGVVGGGVGIWNVALDAAFAFNTLVAGGALQVVDITNPTYNFEAAEAYLSAAQNTPQGQARIALTAALADTPGWYNPAYPPPAPTDYADQENNQYEWFSQVDFPFDFALRAELEARAGGNPSWNNGVNYDVQLSKSVNRDEVIALYKTAGLSLDADLATLRKAQRITADSSAVTYLSQNIIFDGQISIPVLTMHTEGDGLVGNQNESAYELAVQGAGNQADLRRLFIYRAGHCEFTPAETIAAFEQLISRLDTGHWGILTPQVLNGSAAALGNTYNPVPPQFNTYHPLPFLRLYNGTP